MGLRSRWRRVRPRVLRALDRGVGRELLAGHRRDLRLHGHADHTDDADRHTGFLQLHQDAPEGVLRADAPAADGRDRRVPGHRYLPLLRLLRAHAGADVLHRRYLGRRAQDLRRRQVLPLHGGRVAADAGRDPVHLLQFGRGVVQLRGVPQHRPHDAGAALALRGLRAGFRDQGTDLPVPHLAARRARGGAHSRVGHPGLAAAQDGHLRLPEVPAAALSRSGPAPHGGRGDALRGCSRDHLRGLGGGGAARRQEACGLYIRSTYGVRRDRHLRHDRERTAGRPDRHDQPRGLHRRALPSARDDVRAAPHPPHRRLRRHRTRGALLRHRLRDHRPRLDRSSGHQRLHRRVPGPARHLRDPPGHGGRRGDRGDLRGLLHAPHGTAHPLQQAGQGGEPRIPRPVAAGDVGPRAPGRAHDLDRRAAHAFPGAHGAERAGGAGTDGSRRAQAAAGPPTPTPEVED